MNLLIEAVLYLLARATPQCNAAKAKKLRLIEGLEKMRKLDLGEED